jgi:cysteine desulfurase
LRAEPIYLDHNATTPVAPEVLDAVGAALRDTWGNPSSTHLFGTRARAAVEGAREQVASALGCEPDEIVFTSGGTESDNAALIGVAEAQEKRGRHIVISAIEHPAVEEAAAYLERRGFTVDRVGVDRDGRVAPAGIEAALRPDTTLVSLMHANNETGVVQPVREVAALLLPRGIPLHTDAAQSFGKIPVRPDELDVDLLTLAGHKFYAPKGVGVLYIRRGTPFAGFLRGAGHEAGRRAGTENIPGIVGLGAAAALAAREMKERAARMAATRDRLRDALLARFRDLVVHGARSARLPNTLSAAIPGVDANALLDRLDGVAASAGAACHSGGTEPSRVLLAMGIEPGLARCTLRLTTGRATTLEEAELAAERIARAATEVR